jgi:hypothetical protein
MVRSSPGAQTERRGDAGPVGDGRGAQPALAALQGGQLTVTVGSLGYVTAEVAPFAITPTRGDPFLQLDELEAALALGRAGRRGLALAAGLHGRLGLARFHGGTPFRINCGLR